MTAIQWIFHYLEIMECTNSDKQLFIDKCNDIESSVQAFYLLINKDNGSKLIKALQEAKEETRAKRTNNKDKKNNTTSKAEDYEDLLSDEDKELWSFMETLPESIKESKEMRDADKFILPTVNKQDIINSQTKIVNSVDKDKKPKLGFGNQGGI